MTSYKHTQIGYLMIIVTLLALGIFLRVYTTALAEPASVDSGPNLLITSLMVLILLILTSFSCLTVAIDEKYLRIKFGWSFLSIFKKNFLLNEIASATVAKHNWYNGWGIRFWPWPHMWIYNISGFDVVELTMKNGKIYRIGTDEPKELETAIKQALI